MSIFEPAVRLVGRLSFRNKLRATALIFGIPLLVSLVIILVSIGNRVAAVQYERDALAAQTPALALLANIHQYVATTQAVHEGTDGLRLRAGVEYERFADSLRALKTFIAERKRLRGFLTDNEAWLANLSESIKQVESDDLSDLGEVHSRLRQIVRDELDKLNEHAALLVDEETAGSRLIDVVTSQIPELIDNTGQAAQYGVVALATKKLKSSRRNDLTLVRGNFNAFVQWSMDKLQKVARDRPDMGATLDQVSGELNTAYLSVQEALTTKMLDTSDFDMSPEAFLVLTDASLRQSVVIVGKLQAEADILLAERQANLELQRNLVWIAIAGILALVTAAFISAYISIMRGLNGLSDAVSTMASGDLSARAPISTQDEIGVVGQQFNRMVESLAERTALLHEKTNDIQNMLHHMPQGILTIVDDCRIHPEYSVYLETIFETQDVAGNSATQFMFDGSNVGSDILDQVETTIAACIGEDRMNFDFNSHLLIEEFSKTMPDGRVKYLEMSWSPICDAAGSVQKIMVCVRDVSELRILEAEAEQQKRELEMVGQILAIRQEKFHEFIDSSKKFVAENESLLQSANDKSPELVAQLFRNMHTIKGNARTHGLLYLTNVVHEAEQAYDELRKNEKAVFVREALLLQLQEVRESIDEYASLNELKLGRRGPGRRGSAEKYFMVPREKVEKMISEIERFDKDALKSRDSFIVAMQTIKHNLMLIGTESIGEVLCGVFDSLPSLAVELGKEPPILKLNDNGIHVRNQVADLLRNVFMHLCRNAIDHGIENATERGASGKPAAGTIEVVVEMVNERLLILIKDDGRGLALRRIREKAVGKGILAADAEMEDDDVAKLILAPGFSTASAVTEISGRGVGMDAVQDFVKREGGSIQLLLTDENEGADYRSFMTAITLPGIYAVESVSRRFVMQDISLQPPEKAVLGAARI